MGFVYLIRNGDLYKIGRTDNLQRRLKQLQPCTVVQTLETDRSRDLEYELHKKHKSKRLPQTEYFRLSESEVEEVAVALGKNPRSYSASSSAQSTGSFTDSKPGPEWNDPVFRREMERRYIEMQNTSQLEYRVLRERAIRGVYRNSHQSDGFIGRHSEVETQSPTKRKTSNENPESIREDTSWLSYLKRKEDKERKRHLLWFCVVLLILFLLILISS